MAAWSGQRDPEARDVAAGTLQSRCVVRAAGGHSIAHRRPRCTIASHSSIPCRAAPRRPRCCPPQGEVMRWHNERGLEKLAARDYIEQLEAEVSALRQRLQQQGGGGGGMSAAAFLSAAQVAGGGGGTGAGSALPPVSMSSGVRNELLLYMSTLDPRATKDLTAGAGSEHVQEAMQLFVAKLMGTADADMLSGTKSEFSHTELSKVLFWLLVVGYTLRSMEVRSDINDSLDI